MTLRFTSAMLYQLSYEATDVGSRSIVGSYQGGGGGGGGEETRSGTEKRCSHNLQSGHPAWWSADNCSIFLTVNILDF